MVFLYLNIKKYHSTKVIFILSLPLFGNVLELISLKWHFQYCKNIIQELVVLLLEYCVLSPKIRMYIVQCPSDKKNKIFAFLIWPFLTLGFSENSKNYYQEPLFRTALRAEVTGERTRQLRRTTRTSATLRRGRGSPGQPASCVVSSGNETLWGGRGIEGSKLPLILLEAVLVSPP